MKTNNKKPSALKLWLLRVIPTALIGTLTMAASCNKPEDPQPTKTQVIEWDWKSALPSKDSVKYYADQPDVKNVIMKLRDDENAYISGGFVQQHFKRARDSLDIRFAINREKVTGKGVIYLRTDKDPIDDADSSWFVMNGFTFKFMNEAKELSY